MTTTSVRTQLLEAQVSWLLDRLSGTGLEDAVRADVHELLDVGTRTRLDELVDLDAIQQIARSLFATVPPSSGASTLVEMAADAVYAGPESPITLGELIDRENVDRLAAEVLGLTDLAEAFLDDLTRSPLVASLASRFVTKLLNDVVAANRARAEKIPGVGSLVSFGTSAAGRVMAAADQPLNGLLGDAAGKGTVFLMKRLNRVVLDTLRDPAVHAAVLEIYDLYVDEPMTPIHEIATVEDVHRVATLLHDIAVAGAPTDAVAHLVDALIAGFFGIYGPHPVAVLLEELDLTEDVVTEYALAVVPRILRQAAASGELERLAREQLTPFYDSPEVRAILGD